jgi:hypothetical protein
MKGEQNPFFLLYRLRKLLTGLQSLRPPERLRSPSTMSSEQSSSSKKVDVSQGSDGNDERTCTAPLAQIAPKDDRDGPTTEPADFAALIAEVKETNRLLKDLVAGKSSGIPPPILTPQKGPREFDEENKKYFDTYTETELLRLTETHIQTVEEIAKFRKYFLKRFETWYPDTTPSGEENTGDQIVYRSDIVVDGQQEASLRVHGKRSTPLDIRYQKIEGTKKIMPTVAATDVEKLVEAQWPAEIAKPGKTYIFEDNTVEAYIDWKEVPRSPLDVYYKNDGSLRSQKVGDGPNGVRITNNLE